MDVVNTERICPSCSEEVPRSTGVCVEVREEAEAPDGFDEKYMILESLVFHADCFPGILTRAADKIGSAPIVAVIRRWKREDA